MRDSENKGSNPKEMGRDPVQGQNSQNEGRAVGSENTLDRREWEGRGSSEQNQAKASCYVCVCIAL